MEKYKVSGGMGADDTVSKRDAMNEKKGTLCVGNGLQNLVWDCTMGNADDNSYKNNNKTVKYSVQGMKWN